MSTTGHHYTPHDVQVLALRELSQTRTLGEQAGLVVLATGLGKTWLSAFDFGREFEFKTLLFVAHRKEILEQARKTFLRLDPSSNTGLYTGEVKLDDLLQPFRQLALRSVRLSADLGAALQSPRLLRARLQKGPMTFLTRGKEAKFFAFEDGVFRTTPAVTVTDPQVMQELVREVCEWKLAVFLDSKRAEINRAKTKARGECSEA